MLQLNLVDLQPEMVTAWKQCFSDLPNVSIHNDSIFNYPSDALVSPANSFGFMNGGIDFAISKTLGWHIEKRLQQVIREKYYGELLVGQAEIIPTDNPNFPYLIAAPTMRLPMVLGITPNLYLAMKAVLLLWKHGKMEDGSSISTHIQSIAISGFGTGVGQANPLFSARCMRIAYEDVIGDKHTTKEGWAEIRSNFMFLLTQHEEHLKYDF